MTSEVQYRAAWVPDDDPERPWDEAAQPCVDWVIAEGRAQGVAPLLITPTQSQWSGGAEAVVQMAQRYEATTPRSKSRGTTNRATLAYVPDHQVMEEAARCARGSSLAVVESVATPLIGWAMEVAALNLLTGSPTRDTRTDSQREDLERLSFIGNNGWGDDYGKRTALRVLEDARGRGDLDGAVLLGYMVAHGHGHRAIARLGQLIERASSG